MISPSRRFLVASILFLSMLAFVPQASVIKSDSGKVSFTSKAALETISAENTSVDAVLDTDKRMISVSVPMSSFEGFNSQLQKVHFNENYLETDEIPEATFSGKIIEEIDFDKVGTHKVRAKGFLTVHGISQDKVVDGIVRISEDHIRIESGFDILLEDFHIKKPTIVYNKVSEVIDIEVSMRFSKK